MRLLGHRRLSDDAERLEECVEDLILLERACKLERALTPSQMREQEKEWADDQG